MPKSMAVPTIVLLASATVTLVGVGPITGLLAQHGLWPDDVRAQLVRRVELPIPVASPTAVPQQTATGSRGSAPKERAAALDLYQVPVGTPLFVQMRTALSSATSEVHDEVRATLRSAVTQDGVELVPAGSLMHGKVVDVTPASPRQRRGQIAIAFYVIEHAETGSRASIATRVRRVDAVPPDSRSAPKRPLQAQVSAGDAITLALAEPLIVRIPK